MSATTLDITTESRLLMIFVPPMLEETLVDWLLENDQISGFSTVEAHGHGQRQTGMTMLEQVTGRQRRIQFMVKADASVIQQLLVSMKTQFSGVGLHYMVMPLVETGRF